jgi:aminoglycoside phosphotransferase (APT) family kinase protein
VEGDAADGIDLAAVEAWLAARVDSLAPPLTCERIAGGRSNLTYRVADSAGNAFVLRRPPLGATLGSAHDMGREHRIIDALADSDVPVPPLVGFCEDESVIGAEFYVMRFVDGTVIRDKQVAESALDAGARRTAGEALVDTLAVLHAVDPESVGLGDLGRHEGYVERQLKRWKKQWDASRSRDLEAMDETHRLLAERVPPQQGVSIVHGDYRLDNAIVGADHAIAAVVDWELCTLGDPLADVGLLLVYWSQPGDELIPLEAAPTLAPGFPTRSEIVERYADRTGRDLSGIDYYVALGYWKLAAILEGVFARYAAGGYGSHGEDFEQFKTMTERLANSALETAQRLPG